MNFKYKYLKIKICGIIPLTIKNVVINMKLTTALLIILALVLFYLVIIGLFTTAFRATGLSKEKSRYQSISLFTNCGFTTSESELITSNRRRRRLAIVLMIIGHVFSVIIVSLVVSLFSSFSLAEVKENYIIMLVIIGSFALIVILFKLPFINKPLQRGLEKIATKNVAKREKNNIITVLDNYGKESLVEIYLYWLPEILNEKSLMEVNLKRNYNLNLVTVKRRNKVLEVDANTILQRLDKIIIFGNIEIINDIFKNKKNMASEKKDTKNNISIIDNYGKDALCEIKVNSVPAILVDTPLIESPLKSKFNIQILMIQNANDHELTTKDSIVKEGNTILVFGPYQNIKAIFEIKEEKTLFDYAYAEEDEK